MIEASARTQYVLSQFNTTIVDFNEIHVLDPIQCLVEVALTGERENAGELCLVVINRDGVTVQVLVKSSISCDYFGAWRAMVDLRAMEELFCKEAGLQLGIYTTLPGLIAEVGLNV